MLDRCKLIKVTKLFEFEASHYLPDYKGACSRLHGHSYKLSVTVQGNIDKDTGMVIDFSELKRKVEEYIINNVDHTFLNDKFAMPTAEKMVVAFAITLKRVLNEYNPDLILDKITLWETSASYAEWESDSYAIL